MLSSCYADEPRGCPKMAACRADDAFAEREDCLTHMPQPLVISKRPLFFMVTKTERWLRRRTGVAAKTGCGCEDRPCGCEDRAVVAKTGDPILQAKILHAPYLLLVLKGLITNGTSPLPFFCVLPSSAAIFQAIHT